MDTSSSVPEQKPKAKYKLILSDFHMGKGRYFRDGSQNILEDFVFDREFGEFLAYYSSGEFAQAEVELILNGDFMNLLQVDNFGVFTHIITERSVVRAVERIISGHGIVFKALRQFTAIPGHTVSYVVGNHDVGMLWRGPRKVFSEACGTNVVFHDVCYQFDGIYVEHGQQHERFAMSDMRRPFITRGLPEPVLNLPWGSLFVAVVLPAIKQERPHVDKVRPFQIFLRWAFFHDLWWGIRTFFKAAKFVIDTILFHRRYQIAQNVQNTFGLLKEITFYPNYDRIAFKILEENDQINVVIFGHTHILRYRKWRAGKEYFNEGCWSEVTSLDLSDYGTRMRMSYAFIEYLPNPTAENPYERKPKVRLKEWKGIWKPDLDIAA